MSRIDDLIQEFCPGGVEFRLVGEIADIGTGSSDRKDAVGGGQHPFYVRSQEVRRIDSYQFDEEALIIPGEGGIGDIFHYVHGKYALHQRAYRIAFHGQALLTKFAYYYFAAKFKAFILDRAVSSTVTSIRKPMIARFPVPVPPIEVQLEVVGVLDEFTKLEAELGAQLKAELEARQSQYVHYRDVLFALDDQPGVKRAPMGDAGDFIRGRRFTKNDVVDAGLGSIHYGEIYTRYGAYADQALSHVRAELAPMLRFAKTGDVVIAAVGETVEDVGKAVAWLGDEDVAIHDDCFAYRHSLNPKFVAYYLQTSAFHAEKAKHVARAKVKRISSEGLAKIKIPVPPPEEQERIVATLDEFDVLVRDLSSSLPAELRARRQQYEYYRDRLLTFDRVAA
jgi:type I restriction enzyme, S subunit